jgi:hypothetical protein
MSFYAYLFRALRLIFPRDGLPNEGPVHKMPSTCALALAGPAVTTVKLLSEWCLSGLMASSSKWCLSWVMASPSKSFQITYISHRTVRTFLPEIVIAWSKK